MSRPFKGEWFYEWQIGSVVFQWRHCPRSVCDFPRINVWRASA